jgi:hypothetical protein
VIDSPFFFLRWRSKGSHMIGGEFMYDIIILNDKSSPAARSAQKASKPLFHTGTGSFKYTQYVRLIFDRESCVYCFVVSRVVALRCCCVAALLRLQYLYGEKPE